MKPSGKGVGSVEWATENLCKENRRTGENTKRGRETDRMWAEAQPRKTSQKQLVFASFLSFTLGVSIDFCKDFLIFVYGF